MKKYILSIGLTIGFWMQIQAQLGKDSFYFRDDMHVNYNLYVKLNDVNPNGLKIIEVLKLGADTNAYTLEISSDSNFINIKSTSSTLIFGNFQYKTLLP